MKTVFLKLLDESEIDKHNLRYKPKVYVIIDEELVRIQIFLTDTVSIIFSVVGYYNNERRVILCLENPNISMNEVTEGKHEAIKIDSLIEKLNVISNVKEYNANISKLLVKFKHGANFVPETKEERRKKIQERNLKLENKKEMKNVKNSKIKTEEIITDTPKINKPTREELQRQLDQKIAEMGLRDSIPTVRFDISQTAFEMNVNNSRIIIDALNDKVYIVKGYECKVLEVKNTFSAPGMTFDFVKHN